MSTSSFPPSPSEIKTSHSIPDLPSPNPRSNIQRTRLLEDERDRHTEKQREQIYLSANKTKRTQRIYMERLNLVNIPKLDLETRYINLEYNYITNLKCELNNLIYLDLYHNNIKEINYLNYLPCLKVLMLGKNQISKIENLDIELEVLDLHGNNISKIENLNKQSQLKILNLSNNHIKIVENCNHLESLIELNIRRNEITSVTSLDYLSNLQRIFLSHNNIKSFDYIISIFKIRTLSELSLDSNPVASNRYYREYLLEQIKALRHLDLGVEEEVENEKKDINNIQKNEKSRSKKTKTKKSKKIKIKKIVFYI
jgi:leucine-rich repeat-containing protein 49